MSALQRAEQRLQRRREDLAEHFTGCPYGCTPTHVQCAYGWEMVGREDQAWWAAKGEHLAERRGGGAHPRAAAVEREL